mgnify:CR=1 FL=1
MLQGGWVANIAAVITGFLGVAAIAIAVIGVIHDRLPVLARVAAGLAGVLLLFQDMTSAAAGIAVMVMLWIFSHLRLRKNAY